jgi:hypothetical protein
MINRVLLPSALIGLMLYALNTACAQPPNTNLSNIAGFDGEPSMAINPANPQNLIAAWMRLRIDGKIWIAVRASMDGGSTWSPIQFLPHVQVGSGSADVSVVFHRSGNAFLQYVDFRMSPDTTGGVYLVQSSDGGLHWSAPTEIISTAGRPDLPIDRPWIAMDNSGGPYDGSIYASSMSAYWRTGSHHIYLRRSPDRGASWGPVMQVDDSTFSCGQVSKSSGVVSIGADGKLYAAYSSYDTLASPYIRLYAAVTADAGLTWRRSVVTNVSLQPSNLGYVQGYSIAADPVRPGRAVVTWIDERYGDGDVLMKRTTDGGSTWSTPMRINDDAINNGIEQDLVWTQFAANGDLVVAWRDRRLSVPGLSAPFDIYARVSTDGGTLFDANRRLSSMSSPWIALGCCNSFLGVALSDRSLYAIWGDYRSNDWEIYFHSSPSVVGVEDTDHPPAFSVTLDRNFPNPFSDRTTVRFRIEERQTRGATDAMAGRENRTVRLSLHDLLGRELRTLANGELPAGRHEVIWDASGLAPGSYILRLSAHGALRSAVVQIVR